MPAIRRLNAQVENSRIETQAITFRNIRLHMETFVATLPPGTRYRSFTTTFGTPPQLDIRLTGTTARMAAGTSPLSFDFDRVRPGSFRWKGTPAVRARVFAWGIR